MVFKASLNVLWSMCGSLVSQCLSTATLLIFKTTKHPMKPHRVRMTHNLSVNSGLHRKMEIFRPQLVSPSVLTRFHSDDYINFLRLITPDNMNDRV